MLGDPISATSIVLALMACRRGGLPYTPATRQAWLALPATSRPSSPFSTTFLFMVLFFAEVHIRSKLRGPPRRSRTADIFRRGVEGGPDVHQDASDVKRTVSERAEGAPDASSRRSAGSDAGLTMARRRPTVTGDPNLDERARASARPAICRSLSNLQKAAVNVAA
jgi:hypothetical protein